MNDFNLKDNKVIIVIICIIIIIFLCVFFYTRSNLENEYTELDNYNMLQNETNIEQEQEDISKIFIHVTGAVNNEGVVEIKEGSRIADAVDAANGFTEDADISQINLAYQLEDGQKIYIPRINDEKINGEEKGAPYGSVWSMELNYMATTPKSISNHYGLSIRCVRR